MLTLKNITINSKTAEADYFPEAEVEASHIVVDLENAEIMSLFEGKGSWEMYSSHAMQALIHMAREKDKSTERLVCGINYPITAQKGTVQRHGVF